jgi:hypothetical protein
MVKLTPELERRKDHVKDCPVTHELFRTLFAARCSCNVEPCQQNCSESAWLRRAQRFVQSYVPALQDARNATPNALAWWSCATEHKPVPTLPEYFDLMERTAGVSVAAREQMTQYLERELPGFDKALGCDQGRLCLDQYQYRATIAANPWPPQPTSLASITELCG